MGVHVGQELVFSLPENIQMSRYGREVFTNFAQLMDVNGQPGVFAYRQHGYLYLASGTEAVAELESSYRTQTSQGVDNQLLDRDSLRAKFSFLNTQDLDAGLFGPLDGTIDPYAAVLGLRRKAESLGVRYVQDRVIGLNTQGRELLSIDLEQHRGVLLVALDVVELGS